MSVAHRADHLRRVPSAVRFLSCVPLLGPLDGLSLSGIDWVIAGGESGNNYRPMDIRWARGIRDACLNAQVPFFFKQWGGRTPRRWAVTSTGRPGIRCRPPLTNGGSLTEGIARPQQETRAAAPRPNPLNERCTYTPIPTLDEHGRPGRKLYLATVLDLYSRREVPPEPWSRPGGSVPPVCPHRHRRGRNSQEITLKFRANSACRKPDTVESVPHTLPGKLGLPPHVALLL